MNTDDPHPGIRSKIQCAFCAWAYTVILWQACYENKSARVFYSSEAFENAPSWEGFFVHRQKKVFLSIYVEDFELAGKAKEVDKMWIILCSKFDLEPPIPWDGNVYPGCVQDEFLPPEELIDEKEGSGSIRLLMGNRSQTLHP